MRTPQGQEGRAQQTRPLRVASHNLGGLRVAEGRTAARLEAATQLWAELKLDVVCLQETHHTNEQDHILLQHSLRCACERRHHPGWTVAAHSWSSEGSRTAGVAILVRANVFPMSAIQAIPPPASMRSGWITECRLQWGGHQMRICNVYFPQASREGAAVLRHQICNTCLSPAAAEAAAEGSLLLWCGDFNFVENPGLDCSAGVGSRIGDGTPTHLLQNAAQAASMVNTFRLMHPVRREYTHMYRAPQPGGSRLDRIYLPQANSNFVARATIHIASPSDHRLALLHITPRHPPPTWKAPR